MSPSFHRLRFAVVGAAAFALGLAAAAQVTTGRDLGELSLEELLSEAVTSVSKKEQRRSDAPAAIAVLSNEDLRRSGAATLPDALRLVPGVNVAALNSSQWAVSARGFNNLYANKLLVLVDGRTAYTPLFAGVYWDLQQPMLDDVDRVEVIRGPGATIWGANAVNGVINVVTRNARETQGTLVIGGVGDDGAAHGGVRYGGAAGPDTFYRVFSTHRRFGDSPLANGQSARDNWSAWHGGMRMDHYPDSATRLTWQADGTFTDLDDDASSAYNVNTLARWTREFSSRSSVEAQAYYDRIHRDEIARVGSDVHTLDFNFQHTLGIGERHDLVWGLGYRLMKVELRETTPLLPVDQDSFDLRLSSAFVQNEFKLIPEKLTVTTGVKFEHNSFSGAEHQPSLRAVLKPTPGQTVWAAASRAVRTPNVIEDTNAFAPMIFGPPIPGPDGNLYILTFGGTDDPDAETVWNYELGWRFQPHPRVSVDIASFYSRFGGLIGFPMTPKFVPGVPFGEARLSWTNSADQDSYGGEVALTFAPVQGWRLTGSHSTLSFRKPVPGFVGARLEPRHQTVLRSSVDFASSRASADVQFRQVGGFDGVPAYFSTDLRFAYRPRAGLELAIVGENLFDRQHAEQSFAFYAIVADVPRRVRASLTWRF